MQRNRPKRKLKKLKQFNFRFALPKSRSLAARAFLTLSIKGCASAISNKFAIAFGLHFNCLLFHLLNTQTRAEDELARIMPSAASIGHSQKVGAPPGMRAKVREAKPPYGDFTN